jgi:hypothetical protein
VMEYDRGMKDGISAHAAAVLETCSVREILEHLDAVGEHFNRQAFDDGYQFKVVFEGLLHGHGPLAADIRQASQQILDYRPVEQRGRS